MNILIKRNLNEVRRIISIFHTAMFGIIINLKNYEGYEKLTNE